VAIDDSVNTEIVLGYALEKRGASIAICVKAGPTCVTYCYFFFAFLFDLLAVLFCAVVEGMAACAAARRAIGTRNGEQDT
jgi:hypothetical protein